MKFDLIKEITKLELDVSIFREMEAMAILETLKDEDNEEWALDCIINNYTDYVALKDDLFLQRLISIHSEEELKELLHYALEMSLDKVIKSKKVLCNGKEYNIRED